MNALIRKERLEATLRDNVSARLGWLARRGWTKSRLARAVAYRAQESEETVRARLRLRRMSLAMLHEIAEALAVMPGREYLLLSAHYDPTADPLPEEEEVTYDGKK